MKKNRTYGLMENICLLKMLKMMRFTIFILFLSLSQAFAVNSYSQDTKLSLDMRNARVEDVIDNIEKSTEFFFMYNKNMIDVDRKVDIKVEEKNVNEILDKLFANTDISYSIKDRQIMLINSRLMGDSREMASQQQKTISGKVTDRTGTPLSGATVIVKGSTTGVITDNDGKFYIKLPPEANVLVFSFIGMNSQEIGITNKTTINLIMEEATIGLDEVVAVGYGTQKKESLTSSITSVSVDKLENRSVTKLSTALQGIASGVYIRQQTGRPGYPASVFDIRGASLGTFSNNPPLVIIDGIVDDINNVNPQDVDKISILKDAAAAAIYGSRSTGGVVIITTKRGAANKIKVNYSSEVGVQQQPFAKYKFIGSADWLRANNEAAQNDDSPDVYTQEYIAKFENSTDPEYRGVPNGQNGLRKRLLNRHIILI